MEGFVRKAKSFRGVGYRAQENVLLEKEGLIQTNIIKRQGVSS
jgi:hypothetical protein